MKEVEDLCDRVVILQKGRVKSSVSLTEAEEKLETALLEVQPQEKALQWLTENGYEAWMEKGLLAVKAEKGKFPL